MDQNTSSKINDSVNTFIKCLNFAERLFQEQANLDWVPGWLMTTLGINSCALGIFQEQRYVVYFACDDNDNAHSYTVKFAAADLCCSRRDQPGKTFPCSGSACPVINCVFEKNEQASRKVVCLPMSGGKGFLLVSGEGSLLNHGPFQELLKAFVNTIASACDTGKNNVKNTSYFLPSGDMAQMWSEMLAGLSHDLRTPLACIKGYVTTLLRKDVKWDPVSQREFLSIIDEETDHIESLIDNLLDSSTLSWKGEIELKKQEVLLPQIVNKVLRDSSFRSKNHQFTVMFPEHFPYVEADPIRIEQVIRNLVDNAVKYSIEKTRITIKGELAPGEVVISVADQGIGIDDEHLNRLFEKFFRVNTNNQEHQKGMGLGLPLARQVLISHGGKIWAKSKLGQGTTLYFTLPCSLPESLTELPSGLSTRGVGDEA